jgi:hypothetical protein
MNALFEGTGASPRFYSRWALRFEVKLVATMRRKSEEWSHERNSPEGQGNSAR